MLRLIFSALSSFVLSSFPVVLSAEEFRDADWTVGFYDNCRLPCSVTDDPDRRPTSMAWVGPGQDRKLAVSLLPGDVGGCQSDSSPRDGAPYWERAEIIQYDTLLPGDRHLISFTATFDKGFVGKRETFFQIHGWSKSCPSAPLVMLQFDWRHLQAQVLTLPPEDMAAAGAARGRLEQRLTRRPHIDDLRGRENQFDIQFDRSTRPNRLTLLLNGEVLLENQEVYAMDCAEPRIKMGIYRPGGQNPAPSRLLLDKVRLDGHSGEGSCPVPELPALSLPGREDS